MNTSRVNAVGEAILAAQKSRKTATGIANVLDTAGWLQWPGEVRQLNAEVQRLRARVAELEAAAEQLALATALEIPRPGNRMPLLIQRVHGHGDRWFISDREGRRWHRLYGWVCEPGGITADEHLRDAARFTLAHAVPTARLIAEDEGVAPQVKKLRAILAGQREDPHDSPLHHDYRVGRDLPEVTA